MVPPAPTLFSTTTLWPRYWPRPCATWRATASTEPPGGKGTIMVTGLVGKDWALTVADSAKAQSAKRILFIQPSCGDSKTARRYETQISLVCAFECLRARANIEDAQTNET